MRFFVAGFGTLLLVLLAAFRAGSVAALPAEPAARPAEAYRDWQHSGSVWLLTTPDGADLPASAALEGFPVLVRLHSDFFDFRQAQPHGEDLRFASAAGEPLAYQIEEWDAERGVASVWVRVPHIQGNTRQQLRVYWGRAGAASASDGRQVFNDANGYASVWHMHGPVRDEVETLPSTDTGTTPTAGMIGEARHLPGQKGIYCGEKIPNYPSGASSHSTEAWFRSEKPNSTIVGWGNEGGGRGSKVRMLLRSPPHVHIDSDFSDVDAPGRLPLGEWVHVVHTYDREDGRIYINGRLDGAAKPLLNIKTPARLWLGGWYHNYDFVGDLDEVRISRVARSADWIKLQYENQKPQQTLVGPLVQAGSEFSVSTTKLTVAEGQTATVTATAGGAQKVYWILKRSGQESIVATDRFSFPFAAGRVAGDTDLSATLTFKAIYPSEVQTRDIAITLQDDIPEPDFTLPSATAWDGRQRLEIAPQIANLNEMQAKGAGELHYSWKVDGLAVIKSVANNIANDSANNAGQESAPGKLILKRAQGSGKLRVTLAIDNGGAKIVRSTTIHVTEPATGSDPWVTRPITDSAGKNTVQPTDNQFFARDHRAPDGARHGALVYAGTLSEAADSVFVRLFADDQLIKTESRRLPADRKYTVTLPLQAGLVKYRTEFGSKTGALEILLHAASNLVCGDAFLIDGQSNADATDLGPEDPTFTSDWIRSFGSMSGDARQSRLELWGNAVARDRMGAKLQVGYWGLELARRLLESEKIPICIINGAVGGTRIDQHQRNPADPTDATTIYGRLLWRVQQAGLTHGIRGVLWHQGENDQGADGPTGGFGWETYQPYFVDMTAAWKEDYPNLEHYYVFQIWPKACSMGINGSDNQLREVQRGLPKLFSNLSVMSTLGIKPPGTCHYTQEGYAEFARLIAPLVQQHHYGKIFEAPITPPNLRRASFANNQRDELTLEFDQPIVWSEALATQFHLAGEPRQVVSGSATGNRLTLKLKGPSQAEKLTYLDSASWNPDHILYGRNNLAALTFCDVPIESVK